MSLKRVMGAIHGIGASLKKPLPSKLGGSSNPPASGPLTDRGAVDSADPFEDPRWAMVRETPPEEWDLAAMYAAVHPASPTPFVAIAAPHYRESANVARICAASRNAARVDLQAHGIDSAYLPLEGDSLIVRMRQVAVHLFLLSGATHLLFWDGDIECLTPECVRGMLATGHDVIAGACPFKDTTGRTVHNLWPTDMEAPLVVENGCVEVCDAGTGFLMISRDALIRMQQAHPELQHWSTATGKHRGAPLWGLFNTPIVEGILLSEDYYFCHLWQDLGGKVYVYASARFAHWGEHGYRASFEEQHGLATGAT